MHFNDGLPEGHRPCTDCGVAYDIHSAQQACYCAVVCPCCHVGRAPATAYAALSACSTECLLEEGRVRMARAAGAFRTLMGAQAGVAL